MLVLCNIHLDSGMALLMERSRAVAFHNAQRKLVIFMHFMFQLETVFFVFINILLLVNSTYSRPDFKMCLNAYASAARIVFIYDKCFTIMTLNSSILFTEPEKCVKIHKAVFGEKIFFRKPEMEFSSKSAPLSSGPEAVLAKGNENCAKRETDSNGH